jgi:hypothetical protein
MRTASLLVLAAALICVSTLFAQSSRPAHPAGSTTLNPQRLFYNPPSSAVGSYPSALVAADFNGDGKLDLAVVNSNCSPYIHGCSNTGSVSILLGKGDGTFKTHVDYTVELDPASIAVAGFRGDGKLDLVVTNYESKSVSVLLGNGDGTFQPQTNFATGNNPVSVAVGDFNHDGKTDIAVSNSGDGTVSILLGNGSGGFARQVTYSTSSGGGHLIAGDFTGSGSLDLVVDVEGNPFGGDTLLGNGDGTFQAAIYLGRVLSGPLFAHDFNGDGILDLASLDIADLVILTGYGNGHFAAYEEYPASTLYTDAVALAAGDFTGSGNTDLLADSFDDTVAILLANSDGTYQPQVQYGVGNLPISVVSGDFNGDGKLDFAVANALGNTISIVLGNGDGTFPAPRSFAAENNPEDVAVGDFNGDGKLDIVATDTGNEGAELSVYLGNGDGTFQSQVVYPTGEEPGSVVVGDFNGDGIPDIAAVNDNCPASPCSTGTLSVLLGNGDGTFHLLPGYVPLGVYPFGLAAADFNRDGNLDLATANYDDGTVSVLLGKGNGEFEPQQIYPVKGAGGLVVGDFNGDGKLDIATHEGKWVSILLGNGDGSFKAANNYTVPFGGGGLAVGDFNGDGKLDLAVAEDAAIGVLLGNGDGTFQSVVNYTIARLPEAVVAVDLNGDGKLDLAAYGSSISVLLGNGDGTFQPYVGFSGTYGGEGLAAGDFNRDGQLDLVGTNLNADTITVWLNQTATQITLSTSPNPSVQGQSVTLTARLSGTVKGVATPTGTITFTSNGTTVGTVTLISGSATLSTTTLPQGSDSIVASYSGSSSFSTNHSAAITQTVSP